MYILADILFAQFAMPQTCAIKFKLIFTKNHIRYVLLTTLYILLHLFILDKVLSFSYFCSLTTVMSDFILFGSWLSRMSARRPVISSARTTPNANTSVLVVTCSSFTDLQNTIYFGMLTCESHDARHQHGELSF